MRRFLKNKVKRNRKQKQTIKCKESVCFSFVTVTCVKKKKTESLFTYFTTIFFASIISIRIPRRCIYCFMVKLGMSFVFNWFNLVVWFLHFPSYCEKDYLTVWKNSQVVWWPCLSHAKKKKRQTREKETERENKEKTRWIKNSGISEMYTFSVYRWKLISCLGLEIYSCWCS